MTGKGRMYRDEMPSEAPEMATGELFPQIQAPLPARQIDRITVFYSDNTYQEFFAKE